MKLLIIFIILNVVNVVMQTIKSIATLKCGKVIASLINAITYGLYTVVIVYMVCELPLWLKALIIGLANLFGVYFVKLFEEKVRKDKLWKVECNINSENFNTFYDTLNGLEIPFNFNPTSNGYITVNIFCATQKESHTVREILNKFDIQFFVTETKSL